MKTSISFVIENLPTLRMLLTGGPVALAWSYVCLHLAGHLKCRRGWRTGYTRKVFHVLTFLSAAFVQMRWALPGLCVFGAGATLVLAYAIAKGAGHPLYEAIAREQDAPHRTYYIIIPYFATLAGGLASNIFFGPFAVVGYLVGGLGDAAGEPVGTRWGRHRYAAPTLGRVKTTRSIEGSAGVLMASLLAVAVGVGMLPQVHFSLASLLTLPVIAMACALLEAASPHGWDNFTMQFVPALMASIFL